MTMTMISDSFVGSCKQEPHPRRARRVMWSVGTWGVSELHQECAKRSEGGEQGTSHSVERSAMKQRYAKVLAAAALPFAREV